MVDKADKLTKAVLAIAVITMISRVLGLARESVTAACFGASAQTDAYKLAFDLPSMLMGGVCSAVTVTFIPVYSGYLSRKDGIAARRFAGNMFNLIAVITFIPVLLGIVFAPRLVDIAAPGFDSGIRKLAVEMTMIMFPSAAFTAMSGFASGYLQCSRSFVVPAFAGIPFNLVIISGALFFHHKGMKAIAAATTAALLLQFLFQLPFMLKAGFRFVPVLNMRDDGFRRIAALSLPVLVSSLFSQAYTFTGRLLASGLEEGSISVLDFAGKVIGVANNIFILSIATVIFAELSSISDDVNKFSEVVAYGLRIIVLVTLPVMTGLIAMRLPVIRLLFERGAFSSEDAHTTAAVLGLISIGIVGDGFTEILNRAFYSVKDTKTPMLNGIACMIVNILLSLMLTGPLGVRGLALSASTASTVSGVLLFLAVRRRTVKIGVGKMARYMIKPAIASAVMGLCALLLNCAVSQMQFLAEGPAVKAALCIAAGVPACVAVYIFVLYILKVDEIRMVIRMLYNKIAPAGSDLSQ